MGRLSDFLAYLDGRAGTLADVEQRLEALQRKYETYFQEISQIRERELQQLSEHIAKNRGKLPDWLEKDLDAKQREVEQEFDAELARLEAERAKAAKDAENARGRSAQAEKEAHEKNVDLDRQEEALKARNQALLEHIADYNRKIAELGTGFGFFKNLFSMRKLQKTRDLIDDEQATVAAHIDSLRSQWASREEFQAKYDAERRAEWTAARTREAALASKLEYLREARAQIAMRSTLERVLFARQAALQEPGADARACPRCKARNAASNHFCQICAQRLGEDRPDFEGSIMEIAEINGHFDKFSQGMRACQEIIGLVRGLKTGVMNFRKSVEDVRASEKRYPLPKLQIDVPLASVRFGEQFDALQKVVRQDHSLHPKAFGEQVHQAINGVFTEPNIKRYFETMGNELSRCATSQWH